MKPKLPVCIMKKESRTARFFGVCLKSSRSGTVLIVFPLINSDYFNFSGACEKKSVNC